MKNGFTLILVIPLFLLFVWLPANAGSTEAYNPSLPKVFPEVPFFTTYAGDDGRFIRDAVDHGARGLVIEGVGAGNVNKDVFHAIKYALSRKVPVVVASRVRYGGVYAL